jgi:hypothetical protein
MSARNSVRDILYRAGAEGHMPGVERAISSPVQGIAVILRQLEHGVLPRRFRLDFDTGARVELDVAERQILGLAKVKPGKSGKGKPLNTALEPGPLGPDDARRLSELLAQLCRAAGIVRISSTSQTDIVPGGSGLTLGALRNAAALPDVIESQAGTTTWLDAVVDNAKVSVQSAVLIDVDEAHVIIGSKEEAEALADWAVEMLDVFLADGFPLAPELETKGAITFAPQQNGSHVLLAGLRGQFLLALVAGPDTAGTLEAWQHVADNEIDGFIAAA